MDYIRGGGLLQLSVLNTTTTYIAAIRRHYQLLHFPAVDTESVQFGAGVDVPQDDGEVYASTHQVTGVVARTLIVRVQETVDATVVTL